MSNTLLIKVENLEVNFGGKSIFFGLDFKLHEGEKIALVGRNGSGKSTLLKTLVSESEMDFGKIFISKGIQIGYLSQSEDIRNFKTLFDYGIHDLKENETYLYNVAAQNLGLNPSIEVNKASGGEIRKASLAKLFAKERDLYLLDEPTNHLDIESILWLEKEIIQSNKAFVVISHDRKLLANCSKKTLWMDRGKLRICPFGFNQFEDWQEKFLNEENQKRHKLDKKIKLETLWSVEGISARRKRNQGRLKALQSLKEVRLQMIKRETAFGVKPTTPQIDSQMVLEVLGVDKQLGSKTICSNLNLRVMKGDRIAIIGPNGVGKTTLLKCLTKTIPVDKGKVRHGFNFNLAAIWQERIKVNPKITIQQFLVGKGAQARDNPDYVIYNNQSQHVISYIKKFQFHYWQAKSSLQSLSGGEFGRLLLAKILLKESNFLALDEPTNDLDVETLDMLQGILADYKGTVIFISHDRDFIDKVAGTTIHWEREGLWKVYAGGWTDFQKQKQSANINKQSQSKPFSIFHQLPKTTTKEKSKSRLSFTEIHRLETLPVLIETKSKRINKLKSTFSNPNFYFDQPDEFDKISKELAKEEAQLMSLEKEWLVLEEKAEES